MENFMASAAVNSNEFDSEAFTRILGLVQEFSRLHLCENLFFPFNRENKPLGVRLGYRKNRSKFLPVPDLDPQGYSLLRKKLRKPLNLFEEK
jgi:hypothetical protein